LDATFSTGWPDGATLSVAGSYYVQPRAAKLSFPAVLPFPELLADTVDGNALITLDGATYIDEQRALHISPLGKIEVGPLAVGESLSIALKASTGLLSGSANHGGKNIKFCGALLQKGNRGGGYTLTPGAAGVFKIEPAE
jgi:hypothetical protein